MAAFQYRARDKRGRLVQGEVDADSVKSAKRMVSAEGLIVVSVKQTHAYDLISKLKKKAKTFGRKVTAEDMIVFNRQMQIIYSVGIGIIQGLMMVAEQTTNPALKKVIHEIIRDISEGSSLHEAMAKHDWVFDAVYLNLVRVGEATGELQAMLERASQMIEQRSEQKGKVKSATFYPKIVFGFFIVVLLLVVYVVLPRLKTFFDGFGADLPPLTRLVMGVSDFFVSYWYLVGAIATGAVYGFKLMLANPALKFKFDQLLLRIPVVGMLLLQIEINTFCILLEILMKSGVSIVEAFEHVQKSTTNSVVARDIQNCRNIIEKGESLATGLSEAKAFPPLVTGLIAMGEEGGKVPQVLGQIAQYYKIQIDQKLNNLSKLIEPIMLFFIFGVVLILALAVFLPMWKMSGALKK